MSKVFVCGDTHGNTDMRKLHKWYTTLEYDALTKDDVLVQLGDWGAVWSSPHSHHGKKDQELQIKWAKKNFTLAVVLGNHENYALIERLPWGEMWGGKVQILTPGNRYSPHGKYGSIYILQRGEVYTINGKKILALGGAMSQDKATRVLDVDWWPDEIWNQKQIDNCLDNLDKHHWQVDYVLAHTCPTAIADALLEKCRYAKPAYLSNYVAKSNDPTTKFFQHLVDNGLGFKQWHFGHWHLDEVIEHDMQHYQCHYNGAPFELANPSEIA